MQRIPEPDLMNETNQALAYAEADFSVPHNAFIEEFQHRFPEFSHGKVLDLGCGPADVSCRFAHAYPHSDIIGVDGASEMLRLGEQRVSQLGLSGRIALHQAYLPRDTIPHSGEYAALISNSLLHHLQDPMALWTVVRQQARPGLHVFIMDLMRPASEAQAGELVEAYASTEPDILQRDFYHSLCAAFRPEEIQQQLNRVGLDLEIQVISDRHQIVFGTVSQ